jgi:hypothetical protein
MKYTDWSNDFQARQVYREVERALGPTLARLMPEFNMIKMGILKTDLIRDDGEVRLVIHLKPNGLRMPGESHFRDHMDGFDDGDLGAIKHDQGMDVQRLK